MKTSESAASSAMQEHQIPFGGLAHRPCFNWIASPKRTSTLLSQSTSQIAARQLLQLLPPQRSVTKECHAAVCLPVDFTRALSQSLGCPNVATRLTACCAWGQPSANSRINTNQIDPRGIAQFAAGSTGLLHGAGAGESSALPLEFVPWKQPPPTS